MSLCLHRLSLLCRTPSSSSQELRSKQGRAWRLHQREFQVFSMLHRHLRLDPHSHTWCVLRNGTWFACQVCPVSLISVKGDLWDAQASSSTCAIKCAPLIDRVAPLSTTACSCNSLMRTSQLHLFNVVIAPVCSTTHHITCNCSRRNVLTLRSQSEMSIPKSPNPFPCEHINN